MPANDTQGFDFADFTRGTWRLADGGRVILGGTEAEPVTVCILPTRGPDSRVPKSETAANSRILLNAGNAYRAAELAAVVLDSLVNGHGAVSHQEIEAAHAAICQYLDAAHGRA